MAPRKKNSPFKTLAEIDGETTPTEGACGAATTTNFFDARKEARTEMKVSGHPVWKVTRKAFGTICIS
ncbi:hypothetical protein Pmar_PMAR020450 [Perkinsus marinus ATCC 50983]|uniref:Uncharacterized protein n=1 Tax=Perkinsus marinus (strain ATCC 50983 / TXsc) TaxID=423536 RepID=C5L727_PERM5|nr:hypothetical protein Pmar_PMAR020450 [Perkinsus marinus ATCC 50983]EER07289.1 hypothetical protein Pmar_PMAR020450 [Perkinsus marinus ATCC 50983]|eukprot:XP_002775473.1 hypothetical protein Pmar_PMAR020450 [Perkinsus marinus ATCC 50983]